MKSLVNPLIPNIQYISSWTSDGQGGYTPNYSVYPNSCQICQVEPDANIFPVASPFFWESCSDTTVAYQAYYDTINKTVLPIVDAPLPT
jgi:hypothetical protein